MRATGEEKPQGVKRRRGPEGKLPLCLQVDRGDVRASALCPQQQQQPLCGRLAARAEHARTARDGDGARRRPPCRDGEQRLGLGRAQHAQRGAVGEQRAEVSTRGREERVERREGARLHVEAEEGVPRGGVAVGGGEGEDGDDAPLVHVEHTRRCHQSVQCGRPRGAEAVDHTELYVLVHRHVDAPAFEL